MESFPPALFWDVDLATIDLKRHSRFVIERVLQFGRPEDIRWLLATYATAEIEATVRASRRLDRRTGSFWALHLGVPREEVACLRGS